MLRMLNIKKSSEIEILMSLCLISGESNYLRLFWSISSIAGPIIHGYFQIHWSGAMEDLHVMYKVLVTSLNDWTELQNVMSIVIKIVYRISDNIYNTRVCID